MQALPTVLLKPGEADRIIAGHPWIYHGSVLRLTHPAADGDLVQVKDHRQRFLGMGFYNSKSKITWGCYLPNAFRSTRSFLRNGSAPPSPYARSTCLQPLPSVSSM